MVFTRYPNLLTEKLRRVINRDTILVISIVAPLAGLFDVVFEPSVPAAEKIASYILIAVFVLVGIFRLKRGSVLDRRPIYAIVIYQFLIGIAVAYFSEVRSFYPFLWLIPIFLSAFYYGKRTVVYNYITLAVVQIIKGIYYGSAGYIVRLEDYIYLVSEFFIVVSLSLIIIDTMIVSEEDRKLLVGALEKAEFDEQQLGSLVSSIEDGVLSTDEDGKIITYNPAMISLLDTHENLKNKFLSQVMNLYDLKGNPLEINKLFKRSGTDEFRIKYKDAQEATLLITVSKINKKKSTHNPGHVLVVRDITKQKSAEDERNAFVSLVSHEFRTPLAIVEGSISNAEIAVDRSGDKEMLKKTLGQAHTEINELMKLMNDFSFLINPNDDTATISNDSVNLQELSEKLKKQFSEIANQKKLKYIVDNSSSIDSINTSNSYLEHIIVSLLSNAFKYTNEGYVNLVIDKIGKNIVFTVSDSGMGIAKSDQAKIFSPFFQGEDYKTRTNEGLGIALYISQKLAEAIKGKLTFESELGKGTTFRLVVPIG